jgi:acylphosphatase
MGLLNGSVLSVTNCRSPPHNKLMAAKQAKRWLVSGRVQGVGFRNFVQKRAAELALAGWARNLSDGRVEVYAVGAQKKLSELAAALHAGPPLSDVRTVEERDEAVQRLEGFRAI